MRILAFLAAALIASPAAAQERASAAVAMEMDPGLPLHTIYYPKGPREKLGIVAFGNGGCLNDGSNYRDLLSEVAAKGFLIIANGPIAPEAVTNSTTAAQLTEALDWAIQENSRKGSKHAGTLDITKIAVMGHSCGGRQALTVSSDPRVKTSLILNSGVSTAGAEPPDTLKRLHGPMLYLSGGPTDIAAAAVERDFDLIAGVPVVKIAIDVGHNGTYFEDRGGQLGGVIMSWLTWQLKDSKEGANFFVGNDCTICSATGWHIAKKNID